MQRPVSLWLLIFFVLLLGFGGVYGGIAMLADPSGGLLQLTGVLPLLPVPDYVLPGLFLLFIMGLLPLLLAYALLVRPTWSWAEAMSRRSRHYWAWTGTLLVGLVLAVWLAVQGLLIGFRSPVQYATAANGLLIILAALMPGVRKLYKRDLR